MVVISGERRLTSIKALIESMTLKLVQPFVTTTTITNNPVNIRNSPLALTTVSQTVVSATTVSSTLLAANSSRKFLRIKNQDGGSAKVYIRFGASAATTTNSLELLVGQIYSESTGLGDIVYTGEVRCISASGSVNVYVEERT